MFVVVAYDIVDDKTRRLLSKTLKNYGRRVQKSVFECRIDDKKYLNMRREIEKLIDFEADSVRYYFLCQRCVGNIEFSGWGAVQEDEDVIII